MRSSVDLTFAPFSQPSWGDSMCICIIFWCVNLAGHRSNLRSTGNTDSWAYSRATESESQVWFWTSENLGIIGLTYSLVTFSNTCCLWFTVLNCGKLRINSSSSFLVHQWWNAVRYHYCQFLSLSFCGAVLWLIKKPYITGTYHAVIFSHLLRKSQEAQCHSTHASIAPWKPCQMSLQTASEQLSWCELLADSRQPAPTFPSLLSNVSVKKPVKEGHL